MGGSIPIVRQHAHIKREKVDGVTKFRWYCSCVRSNTFPAQPRSGQWHRQILTVVESFRQHWDAVHKGHELPDWDFMMNYAVAWAVGDIAEDDAAGYWIAPSGKWPAVAKDYTLIVRLDTDGRSVSGTAEYWANWAAQKEERKGMSRLSDIQARMRELEKEAARYARFPKTDEWPAGTVITYNWNVPTGAEVYTYAVLKAGNGDWYWTGAQRGGNQTGMRGNYDVLVENLADDNVSDIRVATPEDFDPLFPELTDLMSEEDAAKVEEFLASPETGVKADRPARREGGIFIPVVKDSEK